MTMYRQEWHNEHIVAFDPEVKKVGRFPWCVYYNGKFVSGHQSLSDALEMYPLAKIEGHSFSEWHNDFLATVKGRLV